MFTYNQLTKKVKYDKKRSILFNSRLGKKDQRAMMFSNFKPFEFQADGLTFYSVEQRFQWLRLAQRPDFQRNIMKYGLEGNGHNSKHYSSRPNVQPVLNNDSEQLIQWMRECLRYKLQYCEGFKDELIGTGKLPLVEYSTWGDDFWGAVGQKGNGKTLTGSNVTGKLLMELRDELTQGKTTPVATQDNPTQGIDLIRSALSKLDEPKQEDKPQETPVNMTPEPIEDVDDEDETDIDEEDGFELPPLQRVIFNFGKQKIQFTSENFCLLSVYDKGETIEFNVKY